MSDSPHWFEALRTRLISASGSAGKLSGHMLVRPRQHPLIGDQAVEKFGRPARWIEHDHLDGLALLGRLCQPARVKAGRSVSDASPPQHPAIAYRRVNSIGSPASTLSFLQALTNHISRANDIPKAVKISPGIAAVQQSRYQLNQKATLIGYEPSFWIRPAPVDSAAPAEIVDLTPAPSAHPQGHYPCEERPSLPLP